MKRLFKNLQNFRIFSKKNYFFQKFGGRGGPGPLGHQMAPPLSTTVAFKPKLAQIPKPTFFWVLLKRALASPIKH